MTDASAVVGSLVFGPVGGFGPPVGAVVATPDPWRTIESAPKDGTSILVHAFHPDTHICKSIDTVVAAWWQEEDDPTDEGEWMCWMSIPNDPCCPFEPTHWMPLPDPPKEKTA